VTTSVARRAVAARPLQRTMPRPIVQSLRNQLWAVGNCAGFRTPGTCARAWFRDLGVRNPAQNPKRNASYFVALSKHYRSTGAFYGK
jgi:hypothetical protein